MGTWIAEDSAKALSDAYKNADMHAGNTRIPQQAASYYPEGKCKGEQGFPIDWEAHRRFMRGM